MQAAQAFFACDKNEMLAANFLMENSESLREDAQEQPRPTGTVPPASAIPAPARPSAPPQVPPQAPGSAPAPGAAPATEVKKEDKKEAPEGSPR